MTAGDLERPGPAVSLDLGEVRIGVAATDSRRTLATPRGVIVRSGDMRADHAAIAATVSELEGTLVVVGLPLSLDGGRGPAAAKVLAEVEQLRNAIGTPIVLVDERLSTVEASRRRRESGAAPGQGKRGRPSRRRRPVPARGAIDAAAAVVILDSYLATEAR